MKSSKMNTDTRLLDEARHYVKNLPLNKWIAIKSIPEDIIYPVINIIDNGILHQKTLSFDEEFLHFIVTIGRSEAITIGLKV